ncbi:MAG: hypothetical protein ACJ0SL_06570 [Candidatus Rariloculaceae bacterium]
MSLFAQYLGELLPNMHFIRLARGIMLRDASLFELRSELLVLVAIAVVAMTGGYCAFRDGWTSRNSY